MRKRGAGGQALVEFALVIPVLMLLLFGLLDLGKVVYANHTVAQAAREASRVGVVTPNAASAKYADIRGAAMSGAPAIVLTAADVTGEGCADCFYPEGASSGGRVVVNVSSRIDILTPLLTNLVGGSVTVTARSVRFLP